MSAPLCPAAPHGVGHHISAHRMTVVVTEQRCLYCGKTEEDIRTEREEIERSSHRLRSPHLE